MEADCIFCRIVRQEIESSIVYEDDYVISFMDIRPCNKGHLLIVPKTHCRNLAEMKLEEAQQMFPVAQKLSAAMRRVAAAAPATTTTALVENRATTAAVEEPQNVEEEKHEEKANTQENEENNNTENSKRQAQEIKLEAIALVMADGEAAGQEIFHSHLHLIPRYRGDAYKVRVDSSRNGYCRGKPTRDELNGLAQEIASQLDD